MNAPDRLADLRVNPDWAKLPLFDRKGWKRYRFDQMAENIRESVMPTPEDSEDYIGLEHMDSGSLHIRRWGSKADLIGQKLRMRKGDILFARRNAYLRRVAIAPHDGLFSAHGMILRARKEVVLQNFLPFLMMSDRFMERAEKISVGSLSPTINWSTLKHEEFDLPPLEQQRKISAVLGAAEDAMQAWIAVCRSQTESAAVVASTLTMRGTRKATIKKTPVGNISSAWDFSSIQSVTTHSAYGPRFPSSAYASDGNAWQIRTTDFDRSGGINFGSVPSAHVKPAVVTEHRLQTGDFLLSRSGEYAGLTAVFSDPKDGRAYIPAAFLIRYRLSPRLNPHYLLKLCESEFGKRFVQPLATGSAQPNISGSAFSQLLIPIPSIQEQREIVDAILEADSLKKTLMSFEQKQHTLITQLIAGWV